MYKPKKRGRNIIAADTRYKNDKLRKGLAREKQRRGIDVNKAVEKLMAITGEV